RGLLLGGKPIPLRDLRRHGAFAGPSDEASNYDVTILRADLDAEAAPREALRGDELRPGAGERLVADLARLRVLGHRDLEDFQRLGGWVVWAVGAVAQRVDLPHSRQSPLRRARRHLALDPSHQAWFVLPEVPRSGGNASVLHPNDLA